MKSAPTTLRSVGELCDHALVPRERINELADVAARYAVAITPAMVDVIDPGDPLDPIARQFVPDARELEQSPQERRDPIGDDAFSPVEGIVHRYPDRVLLKVVNACAVYCRFCFRREMVGPGRGGLSPRCARRCARLHPRSSANLGSHLKRRRSAGAFGAAAQGRRRVACRYRSREGDPRAYPRAGRGAGTHFRRACPRAACAEKATFVVLHVNHPRELTKDARAACARFIDAGIPMLSQSVLLRGVNDDVETLGALMRSLIECRIKPYYLHHADLAPGTAHLRTTIAEGQALMRALRGRYSGLCQPAYVLDIPDGHGKSPIGPNYLSEDGTIVEDFQGRRHQYPPRA